MRQRLASAERLAAYVRLRRFDASTEAGRAAERHRRAALTAAAAVVSRGASVVVTLISVPLALGYLGPERYGMWLAMTSVLAMMSFADLGFGNGLVNEVSTASGRGDVALIRRRVATTIVALATLGTAAYVAFGVAYPYVDWARLFGVEGAEATAEAGPTMAVLAACFAAGLPASVIQKLQIGVQAGFLAGLWQGLGALLSLVCLLIAVRFEAGLPFLVLAVAGSPIIAAALNAGLFFASAPEYRPALSEVDAGSLRALSRTGSLFLLLQLGTALALASDAIIVARTLGSAMVPQYAVPARLFSVVPVLLGFASTPLWPAYAEAVARGDKTWATRTFRRTTRIAVLGAAALSLGLLMASPLLLRLWVGPAVQADWALLVGLAAWSVFLVWGQAAAAFLNGLGVLRLQAGTALTFGVLCFLARFAAVERLGVPGVPVATVLTYCGAVVIPQWLAIQRRLARLG